MMYVYELINHVCNNDEHGMRARHTLIFAYNLFCDALCDGFAVVSDWNS